jgi:O-antigen ligase
MSGFSQPGSATRENFTVFTSFLMLGFIILSLVYTLKRFRLVTWTILISMFLVSIITTLSYLGLGQVTRMKGSGYGPNEFAIGILPFVGIAFYTMIAEKNKLLRLLALIITVFLTTALVLTFSRGSLIGLFTILIFGILKAKKKIKSVFTVLIITAILVSAMPKYVWERFIKTQETLQNLDETSNVDNTKRRYLLARGAWLLFLDHPVTGVGIGNYYYEGRKYVQINPGRAHTMYLEVMAELGIIGIILFLLILFSVFKSLRLIIKSNSIYSAYARGLYLGLVGFLVAAIFLHAQQEKALWFCIFMALALENIAIKGLSVVDKKNTKALHEK